MVLKSCVDWLLLRSVEPSLASAQLRELKRQIPLLYALLCVNGVAVAYTHYGTAPDVMTVWVPSCLFVVCVMRLTFWLKPARTALGYAATIRQLRATTALASAIAVAFITWSLGLGQFGDAAQQAHVAIFIAITVIGCIFCMMQLPQAALAITAIVSIPYLCYYVTSNDRIFVAIGLNIFLVTLVMTQILLNSFDGFTKLVRTQVETERLNREITKLAHTDMLTGLPNRRLFFSEADGRIARCKETDQDLAVGVIDLDRFKAANDTFGHVLGDQILEAVGQRLQGVFETHGIVARLGGDEFAFALEGDREHALKIATLACESLSQPFRLGEVVVSIGASCGFAMMRDVNGNSRALYDGADYALYTAKNQRRGFAILYSPEHERRIRSERAVEAALQLADLEAEMEVHLQPIANIATESIVAVEALARWTSPHLGRVGPDVFIPSAERAGMIHRLTLTLLEKALECLKQLPERVRLSFNLSAHDITNRETVLSIMSLVRRSNIAPARLIVELTETAVLRDFEAAEASVRLLHSLGIQIALDDFGTGQSSLSYLRQLPIDKVKIDRSFMAGANDGKGREILSAIIAFCESMRMQCVAEGVETVTQMRFLKAIGCNDFQGYLLAKPMPLGDLLAWLDQRDQSAHRLIRG